MFEAALLQVISAKRSFDVTKSKKDPKNFSANFWNMHNKDVMIYCFFKE